MSKLSCVTGKLQAENIVFLSIIQNVSDGKVVTKGNRCWEIASESMVKNFPPWPHIFASDLWFTGS